MYRYKLLYSIVNVDGKNKLMLAYDWLSNYLEGDELQEFLADLTIISVYDEEAIQNGWLTLEPIFENINTDEGTQLTIQIGMNVSRDMTNSPTHQLAHKWVNRFKTDPAVVEFYDEEPYN